MLELCEALIGIVDVVILNRQGSGAGRQGMELQIILEGSGAAAIGAAIDTYGAGASRCVCTTDKLKQIRIIGEGHVGTGQRRLATRHLHRDIDIRPDRDARVREGDGRARRKCLHRQKQCEKNGCYEI